MDPNDAEEDPVLLTNEQRIERAILTLPTLAAKDVPPDDTCPICLTAFSTIIDAPAEDSDADTAGVTKLEGCGHLFCRVEYVPVFGYICSPSDGVQSHRVDTWPSKLNLPYDLLPTHGLHVMQHGTCPACRHLFLEFQPEWEVESSDGDFVPGETDDEMDYELEYEMDFLDTDDDYFQSDYGEPWEGPEFPDQFPDLEPWERPRRSTGIYSPPYTSFNNRVVQDDEVGDNVGEENLGLSEGASESFSEASMASGDEEVVDEDGRSRRCEQCSLRLMVVLSCPGRRCRREPGFWKRSSRRP